MTGAGGRDRRAAPIGDVGLMLTQALTKGAAARLNAGA
jgi:hypothetical protein